MFRALALLMLLGGNPQVTSNTTETQFLPSLLDVQNFQLIENLIEKPLLSAKSTFVVDLDSQISLYNLNENERLPIASLAKLMTALVILEENELNEVVTISPEVQQTEGSRIWLYPNETITVGNLLKGMLIPSGNDAAYELARYNAGSLEEFTKKMNKVAFYLGLENSHFEDPAGLDDEHSYSTAKDLAIISKHILKNAFIRQITQIQETTITSLDGRIEHKLKNTNKLLGVSNAHGLKTGTTDLAKECLISLMTIRNNEVIIIILGSEDRYQDTKMLYNLLENT